MRRLSPLTSQRRHVLIRTCSAELASQAKRTDHSLATWHFFRSIKLCSGWPTLVLVAACARPRHCRSAGSASLFLDQLYGDRLSSQRAVTTISLLLWPISLLLWPSRASYLTTGPFSSSYNETLGQPEHGSKWQEARPHTTNYSYRIVQLY